MSTQSGFRVGADLKRNLLHFNFVGHVTVAEMQAGVADLERLLLEMKPGFTIFTDLSGLEAMDLDCARLLTRTMDISRARGVGMVVRVIPNPAKDIGFNILSIIHYRRGVKIRTFNTLAEAEKALEPAPARARLA